MFACGGGGDDAPVASAPAAPSPSAPAPVTPSLPAQPSTPSASAPATPQPIVTPPTAVTPPSAPPADPNADIDWTPPVFQSATLAASGIRITLTYNETLQVMRLPPLSAFTVRVDEAVVLLASVSAYDREVRLDLAQPAPCGSVVKTFTVGTPAVDVAYNIVTLRLGTPPLSTSTDYYLEAPAGVLKDHDGRNWAGLSGPSALAFRTAAPPAVLITEVNSNATGGDFFELYNFGTTAIDLSGWKWVDDDGLSFNHASAVSFPSGASLAPGERLVVVQSASDTSFRSAWTLPAGVRTLAFGGPGLGKGDGVLVYTRSGGLAAAMNYKGSAVTASDGTVVPPATRCVGGPVPASEHAGTAMGSTGNDKKSAVWNGASTSAPCYQTAVSGLLGAYAQTGDSASVGSPGL